MWGDIRIDAAKIKSCDVERAVVVSPEWLGALTKADLFQHPAMSVQIRAFACVYWTVQVPILDEFHTAHSVFGTSEGRFKSGVGLGFALGIVESPFAAL